MAKMYYEKDCDINYLNGKKIAIFGSYGWGSGEWMDTWEAQCQAHTSLQMM